MAVVDVIHPILSIRWVEPEYFVVVTYVSHGEVDDVVCCAPGGSVVSLVQANAVFQDDVGGVVLDEGLPRLQRRNPSINLVQLQCRVM